jgi:hypothetical protein
MVSRAFTRDPGSLHGVSGLVCFQGVIKLTKAITGLRSFWMQGGEALSAVGALDYSKEERKRLAKL